MLEDFRMNFLVKFICHANSSGYLKPEAEVNHTLHENGTEKKID